MTCDRNKEISTILGQLRDIGLDEGIKNKLKAQLYAWGKSEKWVNNQLKPQEEPEFEKTEEPQVTNYENKSKKYNKK